MNLSKQPYKGTRDFYPEDKRLQKWLFTRMRSVVESFGYQEYDAPLLEPLELYKAKSGDELVNEQTYGFTDRGGREVVIRPEMTPSLARMVAGRRQEFAYPLRLYNIGSRWRYERPQRGRNREFFQLDVDLFGVEGIEADAEIIQVADSILKSFGGKPGAYKIKVNSRNFMAWRSRLAEPKDPNLTPNDLFKVLDTWNKDETGTKKKIEEMFANPEVIYGMLNFDSIDKNESIFVDNLKNLFKILKKAGVSNVEYDPTITRGFDYYTDIVFEVFDRNPKNNRAMFGGGRYDGLVGMFGVEPVPTVGFAMGDVTLENFLAANDLLPKLEPETQAVAILVGDVYEKAQLALDELRSIGVNVAADMTSRKLDAKIKAAAKAGAKFVIFIGEDELKSGQLKLKNLQTGQEQIGDVKALASLILE